MELIDCEEYRPLSRSELESLIVATNPVDATDLYVIVPELTFDGIGVSLLRRHTNFLLRYTLDDGKTFVEKKVGYWRYVSPLSSDDIYGYVLADSVGDAVVLFAMKRAAKLRDAGEEARKKEEKAYEKITEIARRVVESHG